MSKYNLSIKLVKDWFQNNKTVEQLAEKLKCSKTNIYGFCSRNNIEIPKETIIGRKWFELEVIKFVEKRKKKNFWECKCKCGNKIILPTSIINSQRTKSCGLCIKKKNGCKNYNWNGYEGITGNFWSQIIKSAKERNIEFNLSKEYIWNLYLKQNKKCALSNLDIKFEESYALRNKRTVSLDRIDSNKGYIEGNVQWVHKDINKMKNNFDENRFIELCSAVFCKVNQIHPNMSV